MFKNIYYLKNEKLAQYSTINIGGNAKYIVFPKSLKELRQCIKITRENKQKVFVLGNGSNTLFDDDGFDGVVISLKNMQKIIKKQNYVIVDAGVNLFALNLKVKEWGLSGLEWSYGIPASIGGFVFMNGGCFGHEICEYIEEVSVLRNDKIIKFKRPQIQFGYRQSNIDGIIVSVKLKLVQCPNDIIAENMNQALKTKREKQPCDKPSLGSVFKRVMTDKEIIYPAKMIDSLGLKGVKIGGAEISTKHAGFIVNVGGATSADYIALMQFLRDKLAVYGVDVKNEIVILKK